MRYEIALQTDKGMISARVFLRRDRVIREYVTERKDEMLPGVTVYRVTWIDAVDNATCINSDKAVHMLMASKLRHDEEKYLAVQQALREVADAYDAHYFK